MDTAGSTCWSLNASERRGAPALSQVKETSKQLGLLADLVFP